MASCTNWVRRPAYIPGDTIIDILDRIGDFFASQPWLSLGLAIVAVLTISVCMSVVERRQARKLARESRRRAEENLRSRDA